MKRFVLLLGVMAVAITLTPFMAQAEYPDKPISYIIPFNPGGESDVTARLQESHLEKFLGVPVNVTHKPCGFDLIMWFHFTPNALIVKKDSPFQTLADFLKYAKENPKAATVGGSGSFSANHLEALRLEKAAGVQLTYVPHTGTGPVVPALLGGHITAAMNYSMLGVQYKDQVRVLAVAADERVDTLPDAPTFKELGYDIVGGAFRGVAAPKGTDPQIVAKLANAFTETNKIIAEKQRALGFVMTYAAGKDAYALVDRMQKNYEGILQETAAQKKKK